MVAGRARRRVRVRRQRRERQRAARPLVRADGRDLRRRRRGADPALRCREGDLAVLGAPRGAERGPQVGVEAEAERHRLVARVLDAHLDAQPAAVQHGAQRAGEGPRPRRRRDVVLAAREARRHPGAVLPVRSGVDDSPGAPAHRAVHRVAGLRILRQIDAPSAELEGVAADAAGVGEEHPRAPARRQPRECLEGRRPGDHLDGVARRIAGGSRREARHVAAPRGHDVRDRSARRFVQADDRVVLDGDGVDGGGVGGGHGAADPPTPARCASCAAGGSRACASPSRS